MKSKHWLLLGLVLISMDPLFAQSLSPEVFANGGATGSSNNAQVQWTLGESVTETFTGANDQLTQGFHQTKLTITLVEDLIPDFEMTVYPNPASELLNLRWAGAMEQIDLRLINLQGQVIREYSQITGPQFTLDLNQYAQGPYYLQVLHREGGWSKTYKVEIIR